MGTYQGRIHYGRQSIISGAEQDASDIVDSSPAPMPSWYNDDLQNEANELKKRHETNRRSTESERAAAATSPSRRQNAHVSGYTNDRSVWAESADTRTRDAARQGTARDARRTIRRHENQTRRTSNRETVYSTGGTQSDADMFQAVAAGDRASRSSARKGRAGLGGINSHGTWHSSSESGYPGIRNRRRNNVLSIVIPAAVFIAIVAIVVLVVRSCTGI